MISDQRKEDNPENGRRQPAEPMNNTVNIGFTGDVMLGRTLDKIISERGYEYPWGNIRPLMKTMDINIINLETTLTRSFRKVYKTFNFKASPDKIHSLTCANVTVANLANNHILDFHDDGLLETIQTLDRAGIKHVGAGRNIKEATSPVIIRKNNLRVGIFGITDNEPGWKADARPGTNYINIDREAELTPVLNAIEKLRKEADIVIVSVHWGPNMCEEPSPAFIHFAHLMSQHGAHVIHGHSAHILQGVEAYRNSIILYDTGDFVDDYAVDPDLRNDLSAFFILSMNKSGLQGIRMVPTRISEYQVNEAGREDRDRVISRMQYLSSAFHTHIDEDGKVAIGRALPDNKSA